MINKERIQKRAKELGYTQSDNAGNHWEKKKGREDRTVSIVKDKVYVDLVFHPYKEGWIFKEAKTTLGAIRIINKFERM